VSLLPGSDDARDNALPLETAVFTGTTGLCPRPAQRSPGWLAHSGEVLATLSLPPVSEKRNVALSQNWQLSSKT